MRWSSYTRVLVLIALMIVGLNVVACGQSRDTPDDTAPAPSFMFHVFDPGHGEKLGDSFAQELKDDLNENMTWTAPPYFWTEIEPADNEFNWEQLDGFIDGSEGEYRVINLGPELMPTDDGDFFISGDVPDWLENRYSNPRLKEQYGELLYQIVSRYRDDINMWWIGLEVNLGGDGLSWAAWRDWLIWQVSLIRETDPETRIAVSFGSWSDYHEAEIPPNAIGEIDGARELMDAGVDFDVIAIEYHYGTLQNGDINSLRQALTDLASVGKEIFIWEIFYPGGSDAAYQDYWDWKYPPAGGYTEAWQAGRLSEVLRLAYEIPEVIGINIMPFQDITYADIDPEDWEAGWRCHAGLVRADGTPKEAYYVVKDVWSELSGQ